jgi:hypothetical protein
MDGSGMNTRMERGNGWLRSEHKNGEGDGWYKSEP